MPRSYRAARSEEHRALAVADANAFGDSTAGDSIDRTLERMPLEDVRVLEEDGVIVGLLLARWQRVFWGGRAVPAGQLSGLSIGAEHRGRGAGGELLRAYLAEAHERGAALLTLFPATLPLYRRAGFEYAGTWTLYEASARHVPVTWPQGYRVHPTPVDDPAPLQERFARIAPRTSGLVDRDASAWRAILGDRGSGPPQAFLIDGPAGPDGWAVLKLESASATTSREPTATVSVLDWGAATHGGWQSLLALPGGFASLDATVAWNGPEPEPLGLLLREQDLRQARQFRWMARVLDVPSAFSARGYPPAAQGSLTVEVADETCPWVAGTWTIEVDGGEGKAARVSADARVRTTARGLSALFAGYLDPRDLAELGLVEGLEPAEVELLQAIHAGPRPWSPDFY